MTITKPERTSLLISGDNDDDGMGFCRGGMPMTMSMDGFRSALYSKGPADCITFLFHGWVLDRPGKFVCAMIGTFVLAVVSEGIAHGSIHVRNSYLVGRVPVRKRKTIMSLMYGVQQLLGWILMLISMTFSIELFTSVVMGLFVGKLLFPADVFDRRNRTTRGSSEDEAEDGQLFFSLEDTTDQDETDRLPQEETLSRSPLPRDGSSESAMRRRRR